MIGNGKKSHAINASSNSLADVFAQMSPTITNALTNLLANTPKTSHLDAQHGEAQHVILDPPEL